MAGGQNIIEESVRMANMSQCADDAKQRAFNDAMVELGKTPIDLVSGDEDSPDAPCDEAPCDEKVPELKGSRAMIKRRRGALKRMDAPFASTCIIVQPKTRARETRGATRFGAWIMLKAQTKGLAKSKASKRELKVIEAEV